MKKKIILLELFSGTGGFAKGLKQAGFEIMEHYFSEVDLHAIANYLYNFKNSQYVGSVTDVRGIIRTINSNRQYPLVITFGSPCQDFSLAGKRAGMDGQKSSLIKYALFLIKWLKPDVYIWENVKGAYSTNNGADYWAIIKAFADIDGYRREQQLLNTSWFLPQNRERIYLVGHLGKECGKEVFPTGQETSIYNETKQKKSGSIASTLNANDEKSWVGNFIQVNSKSNWKAGYDVLEKLNESYGVVKIKSATSQGYEQATEGDSVNLSNPNSATRRGRVGKGIAQTLDTSCNQAVIGAFRGRNPENPKSRKSGEQTEQMLEINENGISNTLTSVQKDNVVIGTWRTHKDGQGFREVADNNCPTIPARAREDGSGQPVILSFTRDAKGKVVNRNEREICNTITSATGSNGSTDVQVKQDLQIRRLTEIEYERLQGFDKSWLTGGEPENWTKFGLYPTKKVSQNNFIKKLTNTERIELFKCTIVKEVPSTQRYKMMGNAVTVDVVEAIGKKLIE